MKVLVAGATGAMGRPLVRLLVANGHEVVGLTRHPAKRPVLEALGARSVVADALDAPALERAVAAAAPTHVVHLLTALPALGPQRPHHLAATNRLRREGTANLLRAALGAGARRLVAESFAGVYGATSFARPADESTPLGPATGPLADAIGALRELETQLAAARAAGAIETVALRFGLIYGRDVPSTAGVVEQLRRRHLFFPRRLQGLASFVHVDDAASAILAALEAPGPAAVYNVVDDQPLSFTEYLDALAEAAGVPPARSMPPWLLGLAAPIYAVVATARLPLANGRLRRELGWQPRYPSVRDGLAAPRREVAAA